MKYKVFGTMLNEIHTRSFLHFIWSDPAPFCISMRHSYTPIFFIRDKMMDGYCSGLHLFCYSPEQTYALMFNLILTRLTHAC